LLTHSYHLYYDHKQVRKMQPYPPLGTLYAAALLRQHGYTVAVFDTMLEDPETGFPAALRRHHPKVVAVVEDNFNFLSKMCLGAVREASCAMVAQARARGARVIVAGSDATDAPEPYLRAGAEVALLGEGLDALGTMLARLDAAPRALVSELVHGLSGVAVLGAGQLQRLTGPDGRGFIPYPERPAWDLVDIESYRRAWRAGHGYFSLNMAASRGCPFRCSWCAKPIWGNQYAQRSPEAVATELAYLKRTFNPDHVWFADDIFGFRPAWVTRFAAVLRSERVRVPFTIQTRADLITEAMAQALGEAGCAEAWIGAESGSQRILDAMNKGTTVEQILTARTRLKAYGIRVGFFIQLGYLDEQLADILATRELLENARPDDVGVSVSYPLPGTQFYELVKQQLAGKTHWQDSGDLAMMFHGTYSSDFYRAIRNLLHEQVSVGHLDAASDGPRYHKAQRRLARRWEALQWRESSFRAPA